MPTGSKNDSPPAPDSAPWLPDFCTLPVLGALLVMAQLVVLVVFLAPSVAGATWFAPASFAAASFLAYLVAMSNALLLCRLRPLLLRLRPLPGGLLAVLMVGVVAAAIAALLFWLDASLEIDVADAGQGPAAIETGALSMLVAAAALRYFFVREQWSAQVMAQARSQMDALQARINPHFLFNSMNTIASLVRIDPDLAERAVEDLSDLFRAALGTRSGPSTLGGEFELIRRYLGIEQLRLGERLTVRWDIDSLPMDLEVPPLLLQPLIENAVLHGIQALPEGGCIEIRGEHDRDAMRIRIRNPRPRAAPRDKSSNRHALDNVRQRIAYHYGERGALEAETGEDYYACEVRLPLP